MSRRTSMNKKKIEEKEKIAERKKMSRRHQNKKKSPHFVTAAVAVAIMQQQDKTRQSIKNRNNNVIYDNTFTRTHERAAPDWRIMWKEALLHYQLGFDT